MKSCSDFIGSVLLKVPLLDLQKQYEQIEDEIISAAREVFDSQRFILGPKVETLEAEIASYCECRYAVGVSSGTDALIISLMTARIGPGDLVITTPYTFFATVGAISRVGAEPFFVDIHPDTYNMDPGRLEDLLSSLDKDKRARAKAVIPVHLYGQCADMEPILASAERYGLTVIEDAAQAIGSTYRFESGEIRRAGAMGSYGCFSFFPSKNLGAFGDGGMVSTNSEDLYDRLKIMRVHGSKPKYYHRLIGGNFRLDALQAAILSVKLKYLDEWTAGRQKNARLYRALFKDAGLGEIGLPLEREERHIYNQFVIQVPDKRDELRAFLAENGVGTEVYYPVPLHLQACFEHLNYRPEDFPVSVKAASNTLALPIYPELTEDQIRYVVETIKKYYKN
jgi:dTDP-4-amino-4,6-dideoxygalactose transaminase